MKKADKYYIENLNRIITEGCVDENPRPSYKDGQPAHSQFITSVYEVYDIAKNEIPIPTLRKTAVKTGINEVLWIYQKQSNDLEVAHSMGIRWWDDWDIGDRTIGQRYGATVRKYNLVGNLLDGLLNSPFGRRHIMNMWQEEDFLSEGLNPCAFETLWSVRKIDGVYYLDCHLNQRSNDYIMAGYINKAQYVALQMMFCSHLQFHSGNEWRAGKFSHYVQNLHVYDRHLPAMLELLRREPMKCYVSPDGIETSVTTFYYSAEPKDFFEIRLEDFSFVGQQYISKLNAPLEIAI